MPDNPLSNTPPLSPTPAKSLSADDVNNLLRPGPDDKDVSIPPDDKDDEKDVKPIKDKKDDKDEDEDEDDDIDLKDEEDEKDEKLDLDEKDDDKDDKKDEDDIEIDAPPKKKEILAKFPTIFKEFPWFEKMIYRDREYTNLFGSFDDAKEAATDAAALKEFEGDLVKGSTEKIFKQIKEHNKKAFDKLVDNYLPTLYKVDKEAYVEVAGNLHKHVIKDLAESAAEFEKQGTEEGKKTAGLLKQAALTLNQYLFGSSQWTAPKARVDPEAEKKESEETNQRLSEMKEKYAEVRGELQTKVDKILRATISDYIDPKGQMTPYIKKNAINDAVSVLHGLLSNDDDFRRNLDKTWDVVFANKFHKDAVDRVQKMYLGKAKSQIRAAIRQARREALNERPSRVRENDEDGQEKDERTPRKAIVTGRPHQSRGKESLTRRPGETVAEFLARE